STDRHGDPAPCRVSSRALAFLALSASALAPSAASAQTHGEIPFTPTCLPDAEACSMDAIRFSRREGLPSGLDIDTGWVPPSGTLGVRFVTVVAGHTQV